MTKNLGLNVDVYGDNIRIPNDNVAKLMYYLDCVFTVIEYDKKNKLTDYKYFNQLTNEEKQTIYELASLLEPKLFIDKGIFIVNHDLSSEHLQNKFINITDETIGINVNREIVIGGKIVKVLNIMVCDSSWLSNFYYTPLKLINKEIIDRIVPGKQISPVVETELSAINTSNQQPIIVNQNAPTVRNFFFAQDPVSLSCFFCKSPITTKIEKKFDCDACCCCFFFSIFAICGILGGVKDNNPFSYLSCFKYIHKFPNCGKVLGQFKFSC